MWTSYTSSKPVCLVWIAYAVPPVRQLLNKRVTQENNNRAHCYSISPLQDKRDAELHGWPASDTLATYSLPCSHPVPLLFSPLTSTACLEFTWMTLVGVSRHPISLPSPSHALRLALTVAEAAATWGVHARSTAEIRERSPRETTVPKAINGSCHCFEWQSDGNETINDEFGRKKTNDCWFLDDGEFNRSNTMVISM